MISTTVISQNCSIYDCTFQAAPFKYLFSEGGFQNTVSVSCGCNCHLYIFDKQFADPFVISSYSPGSFSTCTVSQSVCCGWHIQESGPAAGHLSLPRHLQMRQLIISFSKIWQKYDTCVKKKHLTAVKISCMIAKVIADGEICRAGIAV